MTADLKELRAIAQREFAAIRGRVPSRLALLSGRKLLVLPDRFMTRLGGAAAIYGWVCVSPELLKAPPAVRQAIIAHEWGHIACGHCNATLAGLVGVLIYGVISSTTGPGFFWPAVNLAILSIITVAMLWAIHPRREFEADARGAEAVGMASMAAALRWIVDRMNGGVVTDAVAARLDKLKEPAGASS